MVDSIFLYPVDGSLDVASIERFLNRQTDVLLDPLGTGTYLVCGVPEAKEILRDKRISNPSEFPYTVLVTVTSERVNVFQEYGNKEELRSARNLVTWILEHAQCCIQDEYYKDWTEQVAQQGVGVLYPSQLT
jgi:hypothetical protein